MASTQQETRKTSIFVLVAGIAIVMAWEPWRPAPAPFNAPAEVGKKLFDKFEDPLAAKSLEVVTYDEDNASIADFKVAQVNDIWSIPSHSGYPADAKEHMAQAATALLDLKILSVVSSNTGDRELYGVVTPDLTKLQPGAKGVGTRVTLKGAKDDTLADLVIGKAVKDQPELHYVRRAERDQIYTVAVKTDKFSTKFEDWIEKDLLKLNAFDVREVQLNDYSANVVTGADGRPTLGVLGRSRMKVGYDDTKSTWNLLEFDTYDEKGQPVSTKLADDEELNTEKLNALKTALDDLKIVDVDRKPAGLSQDLRVSEDFVKNNEAVRSLASRGFIPMMRNNQLEMYSSEGEATCTTKDGVRYVLRFGNLAGGAAGAKGDEKTDEKKSDPSLNRYLFVMAQFDESQIPKPQFEPLPGEKKPADGEAKPEETKADEAKPADAKPADAKSEAKPAEAKSPEKAAPVPKAKASGKAAPKVPQKKTAAVDDESAKQSDDAKPAAGDAKQAAQPAARAEGDQPAKPESADEKEKQDGAKEEKKVEPTPEEEQRIAVERENKRRQEEYDNAIKKGQDKVKELNDRFADWYFIISDDVYKKIHLGRDEVVKKKEAEKEKGAVPGAGDLKDLQKGLQP